MAASESCVDHYPSARPVVTIDGPAGAGKSTVARRLAQRLGFSLLDTGAFYRACALHLLRLGVEPGTTPVPPEALHTLDVRVQSAMASMRVLLGEEDVTELIRTERVGDAASRFSSRPEVREALLRAQRKAGSGGGVVAEGRDMGTVVFPDAQVKFFVTADLEERSRRRYRELVERGENATLEQVKADMAARDERDRNRAAAPLIPASDARTVDTTNLGIDAVVEVMLRRIASERKP